MGVMDVSSLDLAAICAELVGTTGTSAVIINRLVRCYDDAPKALRQFQVQAIAAKQSLDQILSFLDSDPPAFHSRDDLDALNIYLSAIRTVISNAQRHAARLGNAATDQPGCAWSNVRSIWDDADISASEERLSKQVKALGVYISIANLDQKSQYLAKLRHAQDLSSARDDALIYVDVGVTTSPAAPPPYQLINPTEPGVALQRTQDTFAQPNASLNSPSNLTVSGSIRRPISQPRDTDELSDLSPTLVKPRPQTATTQHTQHSGFYLGSQSNTFGPSSSTLTLAISPDRADAYTTSGPHRNASDTWIMSGITSMPGMSGMSVRKIKSMALLRKQKDTPLFEGAVQGDALHPEEFRARVSRYTAGVTPAWASIRLLDSGKSKEKFRNRFTKDPEDDIGPSRMQSNFKIGDKKLWNAILHKEAERVKEIMEHRWYDNIIIEKQDSLTALHMAASLGLCSIVQVLLTSGANPNCADRFGLTPLHYAADFGCPSCLQILVEGGAKVNGVPPRASVKPPIWYAADRGHVEAVQILLRYGAHFLSQITTIKETLLHIAVKSGSVPICQSLLGAGANANESFLTLLMAASRSAELLGCLRRAGADINRRDTNQETLLHKYVTFGNVAMVNSILSLGADPNLADISGRSPLHAALVDGDLEAAPAIIRALAAKGADPNAQDSLGRTPLHLAVLRGRADAVHALSQAGADHGIADKAGTTPQAEAEKPDYAERPAGNRLSDYKMSKHIMDQWHLAPVRRKPTLPSDMPDMPDIPEMSAGPTRIAAAPKVPGGMQVQELEAISNPHQFAAELPG